MANLASNKWYLWYLREVANGHLELPDYEENEDGSVKIYYGELFCRVPDCSKAQKKYTATNNLRTHLESHEDIELQEGNNGGRVAQKVVDEAVKWYKGLFSGIEPQAGDERSIYADSSAGQSASGLPPLPVKKDGSVHVTNMRKKVVEFGRKVPCDSCANRNDCCKDIDKCDHFVHFDCGEIHPTLAPSQPTTEEGTA